MQRRLPYLLLFAALAVGAARADEPVKKPATALANPAIAQPPGIPMTPPPPTGYDVAIVGLSSTRPEGSPPSTLKVTFENKGTQPLDHDLFLQVRIAGQPAMLRSVHVRLQPGARTTWIDDYQAEAYLYPWGTDVWAKIDAQGALREDNESNNEMQRVLRKTMAGAQPGIRP